MSDLISREAAIALAKDICVHIKDGTVYKHRCIDPDAIKKLPSKCNVIYCRDCMFYLDHRCQATRGLDDWRNQDDYCSRAERRRRMNDDTISRQAAIDALKVIPDHNDGMVFEALSHALRDIETLPSAQRWIPVTERLPKKNGEYLVTEIDCITCERLTDIAYHGDFICTNNGFYKANEIVAWMPLPEPWKEVTE